MKIDTLKAEGKSGEVLKLQAKAAGESAKDAASAAAKKAAEATASTYAEAAKGMTGVDSALDSLIDRKALVTRIWRVVPAEDDSHHMYFISVRHYSLTQFLTVLLVSVNNQCVFSHEKAIPPEGLPVPFALGGKTGKLVITKNAEKGGGKFVYELTYNDEEIDDCLTEDYTTEGDALGFLAETGVRIAKVEEREDAEGYPCVMYEIVAQTSRGDEAPVSTWKRFKEFDRVRRLVLSYYSGTDHKAAVPKLPKKTFGKSSKDPKFLEERRAGLEAFLNELVKIERALINPDLLAFLGVLASTKMVQRKSAEKKNKKSKEKKASEPDPEAGEA